MLQMINNGSPSRSEVSFFVFVVFFLDSAEEAKQESNLYQHGDKPTTQEKVDLMPLLISCIIIMRIQLYIFLAWYELYNTLATHETSNLEIY